MKTNKASEATGRLVVVDRVSVLWSSGIIQSARNPFDGGSGGAPTLRDSQDSPDNFLSTASREERKTDSI